MGQLILRPFCPSGRRFKAKELATDYAFDLALLKVDAADLQPVILDVQHEARRWRFGGAPERQR